MTRRRAPNVVTAPLAITSAGEIIVNAYQLTGEKDDLAAAIEVAEATGLDVFVDVIVPARFQPKFLRDGDDAAADIVGRTARLLVKRGRGRRRRPP